MRWLISLSLVALAALWSVSHAAEPANTCSRLAHGAADKIQLDCPAGSTPAPQTSDASTCRRLIQPGDTKIQTFCGNTAHWDQFDNWAVHAELSCRWAGTANELCLSPSQWESFDRETSRRQDGPGTTLTAPPVDEVIVNATRTLTELRKEIIRAEDLFLAKYNELNKIPEFAINCEDEATTGSRFVNRGCRAEFVTVAIREDAQAWFRGTGLLNESAPIVMLRKTPAFRKNMVDLARQNPELRQLGQARAALEDQYNQKLRRTLGSNK